MTVAALITEGIGPGGSVPFLLTGGLGNYAGGTPAPAAVVDRIKPGGPAPRTYAPPYKIIKRKDETVDAKEAREIYAEARKVIPEPLQVGLLPLALQTRGKRVTSLPPSRNVDFEALALDLRTINVLIAAIQQAYEAAQAEAAKLEQAIRKRKRDEEAILIILAQHL